MDSRRDFTSKKVFSGYFSELGEKANSALPVGIPASLIFLILFSGNRQILGLATGAVGHSLFYSRR